MKKNLSLPQKLQQTENQLQKQGKSFKQSWKFYQPKSIKMDHLPLVRPEKFQQNPNSNLQILKKRIVCCSLPKIDKPQQGSKTERQSINSYNFQQKIKIRTNIQNTEQNRQQLNQNQQEEQNSSKNQYYHKVLQRIKDLKQFNVKEVNSLQNSQRSSSPNISQLLERRGFDMKKQSSKFKLSLAKSNFELNKLVDNEEIIDNKTKMQQNCLQKYLNGSLIRKKSNFC